MFRYRPADYCDKETARCRIAPSRLRESGLSLGQWISLVRDVNSGHEPDQIFCRVWPARQENQTDNVLVDRSIFLQGEEGDSGVSSLTGMTLNGQNAVTKGTNGDMFYGMLKQQGSFL